jgi:hypothetical protein
MNVCMQDEQGRWRWQALEVHPGGSGRMHRGSVTYSTEAEALADLEDHHRATLDETGRMCVPKQRIDAMLAAVAEQLEACAGGARAGPCYWHERDDDGCNWGVRTFHGEGAAQCLEAMQREGARLRGLYSVPDED